MWHLIKSAFCFVMKMLKWIGGISFWTTSIALLAAIILFAVLYYMNPNLTKYCLQTTQDKEKQMMRSLLKWTLWFWTSGGVLLFLLKSF